jgi:hypothetical protein
MNMEVIHYFYILKILIAIFNGQIIDVSKKNIEEYDGILKNIILENPEELKKKE